MDETLIRRFNASQAALGRALTTMKANLADQPTSEAMRASIAYYERTLARQRQAMAILCEQGARGEWEGVAQQMALLGRLGQDLRTEAIAILDHARPIFCSAKPTQWVSEMRA